MRKIIVSEFVSLDGVMEAPGPDGSTKFAGWTSPYGSADFHKFKFDELVASGGLLLGGVTYAGFATAWPQMTDEAGFADYMNNLPKFVVSTTLKSADWNNSTIIKSDVAAEVKKLKQADGQDILVFGSAQLVQFLVENDLVDELRLMVFPVVLNQGKRLFKEGGQQKAFKLSATQQLGADVVVLTYHPDSAKQ